MARQSISTLPADLRTDIERAGYLPALVADVVATAVAGEPVEAHLVHQETTFDELAVRRHLTVLVLTSRRLVIAHADDHETGGGDDRQHLATATTETVPLTRVRGVMLSHVLADPERFAGGLGGRVVTLTVGWGAVSRLDLFPASCSDPTCEGDHGYEGTTSAEDLTLRIAADADGPQAVAAALEFARQLSVRLGR